MTKSAFIRCLLLLTVAFYSLQISARPGAPLKRKGDEIVVAGQFFHTGTKVVLWLDPGGYDAYRVERRFSPLDKADWESTTAELNHFGSPNRYDLRRHGLTDEELERVRGGGWDLETLQKIVDQFVIHYDVAGTSRQCFKVLHDMRDLSVHFMLDIDGTLYQTLDLKERARHATISNTRSVGIEIANVGAYPPGDTNTLGEWYLRGANGKTFIKIPERFGDGGLRNTNFVGHPSRAEPVDGAVQGKELVQYDFTPEQYKALIKLTATLCKVFPRIKCDCPRDEEGGVVMEKLPDDELAEYHGVLGHFHIQTDKIDPGPAFQWERVITKAQKLLNNGLPDAAAETGKGHMRPKF